MNLLPVIQRKIWVNLTIFGLFGVVCLDFPAPQAMAQVETSIQTENFAQAESTAQTENADEPFAILESLCELAKSEQMCVYAISEIHNGQQRTVQIQPASRCQNIYSVAKPFVVTAIGMLEDEGKIDTEDLVYPIFEKQFPSEYDAKWKRVKVSDVMRHRAGWDRPGFLDIDAEDPRTWSSEDFLQIVLSAPLAHEPGEQSVYSDAAFYLLSRVVSEKSGQRLDDFLRQKLFRPMKFAEYAFSTCPDGYPMGATGLYISAEDMAKLGQLYVQRGVYDGKRLLSERFVDKVLARGFEFHPVNHAHAYGKGGMNGQFLYFNMDTGRVIAIQSFGADIDQMLKRIVEMDQ